jgi:hypothetical protein
MLFLLSFASETIDTAVLRHGRRGLGGRLGRELSNLAAEAKSESVRSAILARASNCRFMAKDVSDRSPLVEELDQCVRALASCVERGEELEIVSVLSVFDDLVARRERELLALRSKL